MIEVGAFEAKTKLSSLLEKVSQGEEVLITRRGKAVARLVSAVQAERSQFGATVKQLLALRKKVKFGKLDWKTLRDDGALVPALWHLELGNVLARAKKHERITTAQIAAIVELVNRLSITADTDHSCALKEVLSLARAESIPDHLLTPPIWNSPCGTESRWRRWTRRWSRRPTESLRSRTQRASTADSCIASR